MFIQILHGDIYLLDIRTRMPFKYGIATMTSTPHVFVRLRAEIDGRPAIGIAADHMPPKWFTKDPNRSLDDEIVEMLRVIGRGVRHGIGLRGATPFAVWRQLFEAQDHWGTTEKL